jgi:hypothetical protein
VTGHGNGGLVAPCIFPSPTGAQYWVYDGEKPVLGPAPLSELGLIGSPVHAALVWGPEKNKIYFFRGGDYWRFHPSTRRVDSLVPRRATDWRGVPSEIDAAFQDADGMLGVGWLVGHGTAAISPTQWWLVPLRLTLGGLALHHRNGMAVL